MRQYRFLKIKTAVLSAIAVACTLFSCDDLIYDGLEPCETGAFLRFVYDYNMEYANAFPKKVDCVTLYIYDAEGNYLATRTETTEILADENYRMKLDLPKGNYRFVAYGGMTCEKRSFAPLKEPADGSKADEMQVEMIHPADGIYNKDLHGFYFGTLDVEISADRYQEETIYLMKNTNNLRVILQDLSGKAVMSKDYTFSITDADNTLFASDNSLIPNGKITYQPWAQGEAIAGSIDEGETEVRVAYAELSFSRLIANHRPHLVIRRSDNGKVVVNIPLIDYLLLLKSEHYKEMKHQEFLDRESEWSMIFFLDDSEKEWKDTYIVINDWVVRLNDINLWE